MEPGPFVLHYLPKTIERLEQRTKSIVSCAILSSFCKDCLEELQAQEDKTELLYKIHIYRGSDIVFKIVIVGDAFAHTAIDGVIPYECYNDSVTRVHIEVVSALKPGQVILHSDTPLWNTEFSQYRCQ